MLLRQSVFVVSLREQEGLRLDQGHRTGQDTVILLLAMMQLCDKTTLIAEHNVLLQCLNYSRPVGRAGISCKSWGPIHGTNCGNE